VKLHAAIEMKWRAIVSFHFTRTYVHEVNHLEPLLEPLWGIGNVFADSGYLSRENCRLIYSKGGTPYIRPKKNTTGTSSWMGCKMRIYDWKKHNKIKENEFGILLREGIRRCLKTQ
jgi:hypothetical protein